MVHHQLRHITQLPAPTRQIDGQQLFLAAQKQSRLEAATLEKRRPPDDYGAGQKAQQRRSRQPLLGRNRALGHGQAGGIFLGIWAHQHLCIEHRQTRIAVEQIRRQTQATGLPPGIVVAQRDVRRLKMPNADRARGGTQVPLLSQHGDCRKIGGETCAGIVG